MYRRWGIFFFLSRGKKGRERPQGYDINCSLFLSLCGGENEVVCFLLFTGIVSSRGGRLARRVRGVEWAKRKEKIKEKVKRKEKEKKRGKRADSGG